MIKSLIKLVLLLAVGIIGYNYFLGTEAEKESSKKIINDVKDVGKSVGKLLKAEKEKFDQGKYDHALSKIGDAFNDLKSKAKNVKENGSEFLSKIKELEEKKKELEKSISSTNLETDENNELTEKGLRQKEKLEAEIKDLAKETQEVKDALDKN